MDIMRIPEYVGLAGFVLWALVERGFSFLKQHQHQGQKQAQGSYWLISLGWYSATFFSILDAWRLGWTTFGARLWILRGLGMLFILGGLAMRILARRALGKQYSVHVETSETHQIVTESVYNVVRHPAYLGLVGLFLGIPLSEGSWGGLAIAVVGGVPAIVYRIHIEEQALRDWFGKQYEQYQARTWRLIPYLW